MADAKITQLPTATTPAGTELAEIVQGGVNKKVTLQEIADLAPEAGIQSIVAGTNVTVDDTDPLNPIVSASGGGGGGTVESVTGDGVDNTDPDNPVLSFPDPSDIGAQAIVNSATALTDASSMDLTAIKHTLTTSSATRTFTISYTGDDITLIVTLNTTATVFTFPATALCVSEGIASGDNTCSITAVSGDKIAIAIKKVGSAYYVVAKNFGQ